MKTLLNIMRSIITSLLFIILCIFIIVQFAFTMIKFQNTRISDLIDREKIYELCVTNKNNNELLHDTAIKYIDEYINYVFYKRSFPTININFNDEIPEETKRQINEELDNIKNKLDLDYKTIVKIRDANNFISNGSVYLLINIGIFIVVLLICITKNSFKNSFKLFGLALIISSLILLIGGVIISSSLLNNENEVIRVFANNIVNQNFKSHFFKQNIIYLILGGIIYLIVFIADRLKRK